MLLDIIKTELTSFLSWHKGAMFVHRIHLLDYKILQKVYN